MTESDNMDTWLNMLPQSSAEKLLNPTADKLGKGFGGIASFIANPFIKLGIVSDINVKNFEKRMLEKNNSIPPQNLDNSKQGLALKAVEDSFYQLNSEELQEMFSNLISATLDNRKNEKVSPSFSSVLKDLTPVDAQVLNVIYQYTIQRSRKVHPLVSLVGTVENGHIAAGFESDTLILDTGINDLIKEPLSISSLDRLGLIEIERVRTVGGPLYNALYESYKNNVIYQVNAANVPMQVGDNLITDVLVEKNYLQLTNFGLAFSEVVISDSSI